MDLVMFPFFGNKTLRSSSIPQICLMRCIRINWRRETRRREEGLVIIIVIIDIVIEIDVYLQLIVNSITLSLQLPKHHHWSSSTLNPQFVA